MPFASLIPALNGNQFDIIAAGMFVTAERCRLVAYSVPDYIAPTAFLVPVGNPARIRTFDDVRITGARLGILGGGIEEQYVLGANISDAQIVMYSSSTELVNGVAAGSIDAAALTNIALQSQIDTAGPGVLEISNTSYFPEVAGKPDVGTGAFAFRSADNSLREAFDQELLTLQATGEWLTLARPFGMTEANLPPRNLDTPALCGSG